MPRFSEESQGIISKDPDLDDEGKANAWGLMCRRFGTADPKENRHRHTNARSHTQARTHAITQMSLACRVESSLLLEHGQQNFKIVKFTSEQVDFNLEWKSPTHRIQYERFITVLINQS